MNTNIKFRFTKHSKQRRPNHKEIPELELSNIMYKIDEKLNFSKLKPGKYKIARKRFSVIIIKYPKFILVITIRGIKFIDKVIDDLYITNVVVREYIYRMDFNNIKRKCGKVYFLPSSSEYILSLNKNLKNKYQIDFEQNINFTQIDEIEHLVHYKNNELFLNDFRRINVT